VATTKSAPRRANDRGHGNEGMSSMHAERTALIQQVVKAVQALKPNEAIFLPNEAIVARSAAGTLRFGRGWFQPRWYRVDGLQGAREHAEMLLTGNPLYVSRDRRELVFALKEGACPVANVGRRNFYVVRPTVETL
jgi:lactam utilization protein B